MPDDKHTLAGNNGKPAASSPEALKIKLRDICSALDELEKNEDLIHTETLLRQLFSGLCQELAEVHHHLSDLQLSQPHDPHLPQLEIQHAACEQRYTELRERWFGDKMSKWLD